MSSENASEAFSAVKSVCKILGTFLYDKNSLANRVEICINIILIIIQLALILPCVAYFVHRSSNVNDAAEVLSILFPSILHLGQYSIFILTKSDLFVLFKEFENLIEKSV